VSDSIIGLCDDCVAADANGSEDAGDGWTGFLHEWQGYVFGPVLTDDNNEPAEAHYVRPGVACDGCGSTLGGNRWDYVAVPVHVFDADERA
jgi:hypothetical protein